MGMLAEGKLPLLTLLVSIYKGNIMVDPNPNQLVHTQPFSLDTYQHAPQPLLVRLHLTHAACQCMVVQHIYTSYGTPNNEFN